LPPVVFELVMKHFEHLEQNGINLYHLNPSFGSAAVLGVQYLLFQLLSFYLLQVVPLNHLKDFPFLNLRIDFSLLLQSSASLNLIHARTLSQILHWLDLCRVLLYKVCLTAIVLFPSNLLKFFEKDSAILNRHAHKIFNLAFYLLLE
jgi:hypothetical protein